MPLNSLRIHPFAADYQHHHHPYHQIVIGLSGEAHMDIGTETLHMTAQTGCILPAGTPHGFQGAGDNQLLVVDIYGDTQHHTTYDSVIFDQPKRFNIDAGLAHYSAFLCHDIECQRAASTELLLATLLDALAVRLTVAPTQAARLDIARLDAFIEAHLDRPIRVAQLAALFYLSPAHFTALFRQQCHTSPYRYVQSRRMQHAWRLIRDTSLPLDHIAARTHFADQSALTHAFKRHFNLTPRALRCQSLNSLAI